MHDPFGPSSLWRVSQCWGSPNACRGLPELERAEAREGTDWHSKTTLALYNWKRGEDYGLSEEDDLAHYAIEFFEQRLATIESEGVRVRARDVLLEHPCELYSGGVLLTHGTCDLAILVPSRARLYVVDWKFGYLASDPLSVMIQVGAYAEAIMQAQPHPEEWRAYAHVVNPRLKTFHSMRLDRGRLLAAIEDVIETARSSTALTPGDHCRYCRALGICEATQGEAREVAALGEPEALRAVASYPPGRIEALLEVVPRVEAAAKAVRARARALLATDPTALSSWRLATKRGRRAMTIADALRATQDILDPKELLACCTVSVPELERAVTSRSDTAREGRAVWRERCAQYVTQPTYEELRRDESAGRPGEGNALPGGDSA